MGTLWENGYAYAQCKPIIYTFFDERYENIMFNIMLTMSAIAAFTDKKEFEEFVNELTYENYKTKKKVYYGEIE